MNRALVILFILGVVFFIIGLIVKFKNKSINGYIFYCGIGILFSICIIEIPYSSYVSPIDVYRGKTTLEITYKDNIPIDSVVVYKNK